MKRGLEHFSNMEVAAFRMFIAFLTLLPIAIKNIVKIPKKYFPFLAISGIVGSGIPAYLFATAQTKIDSSIAGILNAFVPTFTLLFGFFIFKIKITSLQVVGVIVGFIGVFGLLWFNSEKSTNFDLMYAGLVILATICYALNVNVINKYLKSLNGLQVSSMAFLFLSPVCLFFLWHTDFVFHISKESADALIYLVILGSLGTAIALVIFNELLRNSGPVFASSVTYLIPSVAVFWGVFDGELINFWDLLSMLFILIGVALVNKKKKLLKN